MNNAWRCHLVTHNALAQGLTAIHSYKLFTSVPDVMWSTMSISTRRSHRGDPKPPRGRFRTATTFRPGRSLSGPQTHLTFICRELLPVSGRSPTLETPSFVDPLHQVCARSVAVVTAAYSNAASTSILARAARTNQSQESDNNRMLRAVY